MDKVVIFDGKSVNDDLVSPAKDISKEVIGTLIIQPPSLHKGGELKIVDGETEKIIDFGQTKNGRSAYVYHFGAHLSSIKHEFGAITKGHRLLLFYSIRWIKGGNSTPILFFSKLLYLLDC